MADRNDYKVGYKCPPVATRFKPGQSGNPKGRKKHTHNFKADVRDELDELITVREGGREIRTTKQRALVKALVAAAIKGDMRATNALVSFCAKAFGDEEEPQSASEPKVEDLDMFEEFMIRQAKGRKDGTIDTARSKADGKEQ
jgi:hypothetical protein